MSIRRIGRVRLVVDENLASAELLTRLRKAGHDVETLPKGASDLEVWARAQDQRRALVTANPADFDSLATATARHHGLLLVYRDREPAKRMDASDIAAAIERVREIHGDDLTRKRILLNEWRRAR